MDLTRGVSPQLAIGWRKISFNPIITYNTTLAGNRAVVPADFSNTQKSKLSSQSTGF
jgi:hypothetical protein